MGVKRLTRKFDRVQPIGTGDVAALADERMSAQSGLQADLVALSGLQPHFDQRCDTERLEDPIDADGLSRARVPRAWISR